MRWLTGFVRMKTLNEDLADRLCSFHRAGPPALDREAHHLLDGEPDSAGRRRRTGDVHAGFDGAASAPGEEGGGSEGGSLAGP